MERFCGMHFDDFAAVKDRMWPYPDLTIATGDDRLLRSTIPAAAQWSDASGLNLSVVLGGQSADTNMHLSMVSGDHGDGVPLDGPGGVLAHMWYPYANADYRWEGHGHFDATERWALSPAEKGFRLDIVVLHELGHGLGLGHNPTDRTSVMYPFYSGVDTLSRDDIAGIQSLYGPPPEPDPVSGDPFHWHHERTEGWNYEFKWLLDAIIQGRVYGTEYRDFRGRIVPGILVDVPWDPPDA